MVSDGSLDLSLLDAEEREDQRFEELRNRVAGVLLCAAIADALGWPTEFTKSRAHAEKLFGVVPVTGFRSWEKKTGGRFNTYLDYISPGEYSDDTQLTLCTARSIRSDGSFDPLHFCQELSYWLDYARGAGATITKASRAIKRASATWDNNFFDGYVQAGANGAAMRIAPHVLANIRDENQALRGIWQNTIITHGHPRALWGALLYAKVLSLLLQEGELNLDTFLSKIEAFVSTLSLDLMNGAMSSWQERWSRRTLSNFLESFNDTRTEILSNFPTLRAARELPLEKIYSILGCMKPATRGSGTGTVMAAIAVFLRHGGDYKTAVLKAVNMFGSDTDTIAGMVGGMVGALKGYSTVPDQWINGMQDYGYYLRTAEALTRIALRKASVNDLLIDNKREQAERRDRDIVSLAQNREIQRNQRVTHPILGLGWVSEIGTQQIKRRGAGTMLLARVHFDTGQSCVFRSYKSVSGFSTSRRVGTSRVSRNPRIL